MLSLTDREAKLEREQKRWKLEKEEIKREILKDTATLRTLKDRKGKLQETNNELITEVKAKTEEGIKAVELLGGLAKKIETKQKALDDILDQIDDLNEVLVDKKRVIKSGLSKYKDEVKAEIDSTFSEETQRNKDLEAENEKLDGLVTKRTEDLNDLKASNVREKRSHAADVDKMATEKTETTKKLKVAVEETELAEKELKKVQQRVAIAEGELTKKRTEHQGFIAYEKKATKILKTKDEELQQRESLLQDEEQMLSNRRSFLPPMN